MDEGEGEGGRPVHSCDLAAGWGRLFEKQVTRGVQEGRGNGNGGAGQLYSSTSDPDSKVSR